MAVVNVWGKLNNGSEVNFARIGDDVWEVTVAFESPDGRYVAEVWANDTAGNVAYTMAIVYIVSGKVTCLKFVGNKFKCRYICPKNCLGETAVTDKNKDKNKKPLRFLLGEKHPLYFEAFTEDGTDFVIGTASYILYRYNSVIEEGPMKIDDHKLSFVFEPKERGYYVLDAHYTVGSYSEVERWEIDVD